MENTKAQNRFENVDCFIAIGNHIAYFRKKKGYTQEDLARRVGISKSYISKIESDNYTKSFSMSVFLTICRELDTPPQTMFEPLP